IADAEHRHTELPHSLWRDQVVRLVGAGVAAGKNDALRVELADERIRHVVRMDLAIHMRLAHAPCDQLRDLRAEVGNEDLVVRHGVAEAATVVVARWRRKWRMASSVAVPCNAAQK